MGRSIRRLCCEAPVEGVDPPLHLLHLGLVRKHAFVEFGGPRHRHELVAEDRFEPALFGGDLGDGPRLIGAQAGAPLQSTQSLREALLDLGQIGQVSRVGVAAVGVGDPSLVSDVGADLLGEELGLGQAQRLVVGIVRCAVAPDRYADRERNQNDQRGDRDGYPLCGPLESHVHEVAILVAVADVARRCARLRTEIRTTDLC